jgi:stage II sporulation protein AB (anti-sigma F factor)
MDNKMKFEFYSRPENESFARTAIAAFVAHMDPTIEELTEIKTAVSEAVSNAVIHAYPDNQDGIISVECHTGHGKRVIIIVSDEGVGIENIEKAKEPMFTTGKSDERSGMGFTVMESFMDKLEVESAKGRGTRVTMLKNLDLGYEL